MIIVSSIAASTAIAYASRALAEVSRTAISAGGAYSPTNWGGDQDGAAFMSFGLSTQAGERWALRGQVRHGMYTDYPAAGRVYFTPIGVGVRYWAHRGQSGPFLQCLPMIIASKWGAGTSGLSRARPGIELEAGMNLKVGRRAAVEIGAAWIHTDDFGTVPTFDAPAPHLDALRVAMFGAEFSVRVHP